MHPTKKATYHLAAICPLRAASSIGARVNNLRADSENQNLLTLRWLGLYPTEPRDQAYVRKVTCEAPTSL